MPSSGDVAIYLYISPESRTSQLLSVSALRYCYDDDDNNNNRMDKRFAEKSLLFSVPFGDKSILSIIF